MRIFGNNTDFYDSFRAYGIDEQLVWHRQTMRDGESIEVHPDIFIRKTIRSSMYFLDRKRDYKAIDTSYVTVWFAGRGYKGVRFDIECGPDNSIVDYAWTLEAFHERLTHYFEPYDPSEVFPRKRYSWEAAHDIVGLDEFFVPVAPSAQLGQWMKSLRVATAIVDRRVVSPLKAFVNTNGLKELHFSQVIDPYQAGQELSMWLSSITPRPEKPIVQLTDDQLIGKHGFDNNSFRKGKQA